MDAKSHLQSLGWLGPGHALNSHLTSHKGRGGLGLTKPLLISQKKNSFGVGKKAHEPPKGNEWWLKGFENALKGVGTDGSKSASAATSGTATPNLAGNASTYQGKHQGLYGFFVRGEKLEGTLGEEEDATSSRPSEEKRRKSRKRKSDALDSSPSRDISDPSTPYIVSSKKQKKKTGEMDHFAQASAYIISRDKDLQRAGRPQKENAFTQFQQISTFMGERDEVDPALIKQKKRRYEKKHRDTAVTATPTEQNTSHQGNDLDLDAEEAARLERRRLRKEEKRRKKLFESGGTAETLVSSQSQQGQPTSQWSALLNSLTTQFANPSQNSTTTSTNIDTTDLDPETRRRQRKEEKKRLRKLEKEEMRLLEAETAVTNAKKGQNGYHDDSGTIDGLLAWEKAIRA